MSYSISIERFYILDQHTEFTLEVKSATEGHWKFHRRYSALLEVHLSLAEVLKTQLPAFPSKKWFGNLSATFMQQRRTQLQEYFNALVKIPEVQMHPTFHAAMKPKDRVILANPRKVVVLKQETTKKPEETRKLSFADLVCKWQEILDMVSNTYISISKASPLEIQDCTHQTEVLKMVVSNPSTTANWRLGHLKTAPEQCELTTDTLDWVRLQAKEISNLIDGINLPDEEITKPLI